MTSNPASVPPPILSRPVSVAGLGPSGLVVEIVADADQRERLARLANLPEVQAVDLHFVLRPEPKGGVWVTGTLRAKVVQTCVVSLDPFEAELAEPIDVHFLPEAALEADRAARAKHAPDPSEDDLEALDEPDLLVDDSIDLGALGVELFSVSLDPYPRKPGAVFVEPAPYDPVEASPFAALKALKGGES